VRKELKDAYSAVEEAKADITGLWALQYLIDKGALPRTLEQTLYTTYLASAFRSVRFGITEAHGKGVAMQFNYLTDEGAIAFDERAGTFSVVPAKIKDAVRKLTHDLLTLEAEGSYDGAKAMLAKYGVVRPPMQSALDRLTSRVSHWLEERLTAVAVSDGAPGLKICRPAAPVRCLGKGGSHVSQPASLSPHRRKQGHHRAVGRNRTLARVAEAARLQRVLRILGPRWRRGQHEPLRGCRSSPPFDRFSAAVGYASSGLLP
jgi:hypothetical protein